MAHATEDRCPIRIGDPCSLCHPGASSPETCGLVYLVMADPELREELLRRWESWRQEHGGSTT
jgi:hypothetical protein